MTPVLSCHLFIYFLINAASKTLINRRNNIVIRLSGYNHFACLLPQWMIRIFEFYSKESKCLPFLYCIEYIIKGSTVASQLLISLPLDEFFIQYLGLNHCNVSKCRLQFLTETDSTLHQSRHLKNRTTLIRNQSYRLHFLTPIPKIWTWSIVMLGCGLSGLRQWPIKTRALGLTPQIDTRKIRGLA